MRLGAKLIFWGLISIPLTLGFSLAVDDPPYFLFLSIAVILAGIARMIYARVFEGPDSARPPELRQLDPVGFNSLNAPPPNANLFVPPPRETVAPATVTEHTTKLLDF